MYSADTSRSVSVATGEERGIKSLTLADSQTMPFCLRPFDTTKMKAWTAAHRARVGNLANDDTDLIEPAPPW